MIPPVVLTALFHAGLYKRAQHSEKYHFITKVRIDTQPPGSQLQYENKS